MVGSFRRLAYAVGTAMALLSGGATAQTPVDLELVLAIDVSGSIDAEEAKLQRDGYMQAFLDPMVMRAIQSGERRAIAVAYVEWASYNQRRIVVDWTMIKDESSSRAFVDELARNPPIIGMSTSISGAIEYGLAMFGKGFKGQRRVIDISGDGPNNSGGMVTFARDRAIASGVTINGLPVLNDRPNRMNFPTLPDLDLYYEGCVIGGPGAFVVVAQDFVNFAQAIRQKLILEIAGRVPDQGPGRRTRFAAPRRAPSLAQPAEYVYPKGCDVGERQSRDFFRSRNLD
jgi:hypothetical protein